MNNETEGGLGNFKSFLSLHDLCFHSFIPSYDSSNRDNGGKNSSRLSGLVSNVFTPNS